MGVLVRRGNGRVKRTSRRETRPGGAQPSGKLSPQGGGCNAARRGVAVVAITDSAVSPLARLASATILVPTLWVDPLGPLLKIFPVLALNLAAQAILEDR